MSLIVVSHLTLDGVVQAPARPDEDDRDGFSHGGWGVGYENDVVTAAWAEVVARATSGGAFLVGRRTYLDLVEGWPTRAPDHPYTRVLTSTPKYVVSTTLEEPLPWERSTLVHDPVREVPGLKEQGDLVVMGSAELIETLSEHDLVDEYVLTIHPLVLGQGRRLFSPGWSRTPLTLTSAEPTPTGVILARYRPRRG